MEQPIRQISAFTRLQTKGHIWRALNVRPAEHQSAADGSLGPNQPQSSARNN